MAAAVDKMILGAQSTDDHRQDSGQSVLDGDVYDSRVNPQGVGDGPERALWHHGLPGHDWIV
jgi:hypothetical protein